MSLIRLVVICLGLLLASPAVAQSWVLASAEDPVNEGTILSLQGRLSDGIVFYAKCDSARNATLAILSPTAATFPGTERDSRVHMTIDVDGYVTEGPALYYGAIGGYAGMELVDRSLVQKVLADLPRGQFGLKVTIDNDSLGITRSYSTGSLAHAKEPARQFKNFCFAGGDAPVTTGSGDAPQPATRTGSWEVAPVQGGGAIILSSETSPPDGKLYFVCDTGGNLYLMYLTEHADALSFGPSDPRIDFAFNIDGSVFADTGGYHTDGNTVGMAYAGRSRISDMLGLLAIARGDVSMTLRGSRGEYVRSFSAAGAAEAVRSFNSQC